MGLAQTHSQSQVMEPFYETTKNELKRQKKKTHLLLNLIVVLLIDFKLVYTTKLYD